jgi:hypothetical protein
MDYSYDHRVAGHLSWKDVHEKAVELGGELDKYYKSRAISGQDTKWVFTDKGQWREFVQSLQRAHMTMEGDPASLGVVVWF